MINPAGAPLTPAEIHQAFVAHLEDKAAAASSGRPPADYKAVSAEVGLVLVCQQKYILLLQVVDNSMVTMKRDMSKMQKELRDMKSDRRAGRTNNRTRTPPRARSPPRASAGRGGGRGGAKPRRNEGNNLCYRFNRKGCDGKSLRRGGPGIIS